MEENPRGRAFKVGDVVELKSGKPYMTVKDIRASGILCIWAVRNEARELVFNPATLKKVEAVSRANRSRKSSLTKDFYDFQTKLSEAAEGAPSA